MTALAALSALERGRQRMYRDRGSDAPLSRPVLVGIGTAVVGDFWGRLASFASLGIPPRGWGEVPPTHPFLARLDRKVVFVGPPDAASPPPTP